MKNSARIGGIALYELDKLPDLVIPTEVEAHTVVSALVLVCAASVDAITAQDPLGDVEAAPASLRVVSLVLVAMLGSPAIRGIHLIDQRVVIGSLLALVAFAGNHAASEALRIGDSLFVVLLLLSTIQVYQAGGIESGSVRPDSVKDKPHRRQTVSGLCAALLFYVGLRGVRAAFTLPQAASDYKERFALGNSFTDATGYSHSSLSVCCALGFGHGVVLATAALVGLHDEARVSGSAVVAFEVGVAGVVVCIAALWAFMACSEGIQALPVLYGDTACTGGSDTCPTAARARRFAIVNESTASLWIAGLAMLVFSFAAEKRFKQLHSFASGRVWQRTGFPVGVAALGFGVLGVLHFGSLTGTGYHTDIVCVVSLVAAFTALFSDVFVAEVIYAVAMTYEQVALIGEYGTSAVFEHLTHLSLFVLLNILWMHIVILVIRYILGTRFEFRSDTLIDTTLGALATAGASLSFALFLASALLIASSNGTLPTEGAKFRDNSVNRFVVAFGLDHFVPLFIFAPMFSTRPEAGMLSTRTRSIAWIVVVVFDCILYAVSLALLNTSAPTASIMQLGPLAPAAFAGALAWIAAAFV